MNNIRLIIREEINKFLEAIETDHYKLRKKQRLESEFTNFIKENQVEMNKEKGCLERHPF